MKKHIIVMVVVVITLIGFGWFLASTQSQGGKTAAPSVLGSSTAKVQIVEFGDYQCPACGAYYPVLKQITDKYNSNKNFSFIFKNFPLPQHQNAMISAEAAEAAGAQGKYWQMHDALYENQQQWSDAPNPLDYFVVYVHKIGLNVDQFKQDVSVGKFSDKISSDMRDGNSLGVNQTPTIFFNGQMLDTLPTAAELDQQVAALLK